MLDFPGISPVSDTTVRAAILIPKKLLALYVDPSKRNGL